MAGILGNQQQGPDWLAAINMLGAGLRDIGSQGRTDFLPQAAAELQQKRMQQTLQSAFKNGIPDAATLRKYAAQFPQYADVFLKLIQQPIKVGEGESLLDPNTYKPIVQGDAKAPTIKSWNVGDTEVTQQWDPVNKRFIQVAKAPRYKPAGPGFDSMGMSVGPPTGVR